MDKVISSEKWDELYSRLAQIVGSSTQTAVGDFLKIRQSSVSDAKRRKSFPSEWRCFLYEQFGVSPEWLIYGNGPIYIHEYHDSLPDPRPVPLFAGASVLEAMAETVLRELCEICPEKAPQGRYAAIYAAHLVREFSATIEAHNNQKGDSSKDESAFVSVS